MKSQFLRENYDEDMPRFDNYEDTALDRIKEENYYKYHENVQEYDPKGQPYSYFYITIMGQIEFGEFIDLDGLQVKFNFVAGEDWAVADGIKEGAGQYAFKGQGMGHKRMVWNLPFEITYRTMTPFGWP